MVALNYKKCEDVESFGNGPIDQQGLEDSGAEMVKSNAFVAGVVDIEKKMLCQKCKASFTAEERVVKCTNCKMTQRADRCRQSFLANVMITADDGDSITLTAYGSIIEAIIGKKNSFNQEATVDEVSTQLVDADNFDFSYQNGAGVITSVSRN